MIGFRCGRVVRQMNKILERLGLFICVFIFIL